MKANETYTPGPWHWNRHQSDWWITEHTSDLTICNLLEHVSVLGKNQTEANARLIASAPELLAALEELTLRAGIALDYAIQGKTETRWTAKDGIATPGQLATNNTMIRSVALARAAIAKAKGVE